jgi:hypothetical protein
MLATPTLFVIGAGASAELGFPVGTALRDQISDLLSLKFHGTMFEGPDQDFADELSDWCTSNGYQHHTVWQAAASVSRALPLSASIDSYLDSHLNHPLRSACGKLAIARAISQSENKSPLTCNSDREAGSFDFRPLSRTWYQRLWSILQTGVTPDDPQSAFRNLRIITFNYDRNIERFLQLAYSHFLDVPLATALAHVENLGILHVYGSLGALESRPDISRSYRTTGFTINLAEAAGQISTYTEQMNSEIIQEVRDAIKGSQRIIFVGFSFGSANMSLISQAVADEQLQRKVYATSYGLSEEATEHARGQLDALFSRNFALSHFRSDSACDFFDRYAGIF